MACPPARRASPACGRLSGSAWASGPRTSLTSFPAGNGSGWRSPAPWWASGRLLLADEPSGALDSVNSEAVMRLLRDACQEAGMTAVVVTHDAQLASWADRVLFLRDGRVTDQAAPALGREPLLTPGDTR